MRWIKKMNQKFLEKKLRWPKAPQICTYENLPAFANAKDLKKYFEELPSVSVVRTWECEKCEGLHALTKPPSPAGQSSGAGRSYEPPLPNMWPQIETCLTVSTDTP